MDFLRIIYEYYTSGEFLKILLTSMLGFVSSNFNFNKQEWVKSKFQTLNFLLLPPIGFAITSSISSNIALSLGMVGALPL